jgi:hypothetical protein
MKILTVVSAFGDYARGAQITDSAAVADALEHHAGNVVASQAADPIKSFDPPPAK